MNVISFSASRSRVAGWDDTEVECLLAVFETYLDKGAAASWDVGGTELGDPQFYLLGAAPDGDCVLTISRLGRLYLLEDGEGRALYEDTRLSAVAARAEGALRRRRSLAGRVLIGFATLRLAIEERLDGVMAESEELLVRFAPQLAAYV